MEKSMISLCLLGGLAIGNGFAQTPSKPNILLIIILLDFIFKLIKNIHPI